MLSNQTSTGVETINPLALVRASFSMFMCKKEFTTWQEGQAMEDFRKLYISNTNTRTDEANNIYLKDLLAANLELDQFNQIIEQIKVQISKYEWNMRHVIETITQLPLFRYSEQGIFSKLIHEDSNYFRNFYRIWDPLKNFMQIISENMKYHVRTLDQAITMELQSNTRDTYSAQVKFEDAQNILHREYKIALYEHARAGVVMYWGNYAPLESERETLREIAAFHVNYSRLEYLKADYGMRDLGIAAVTCLSLLQANVAFRNITDLNKKIEAMPNALTQMKNLINGTGLTFDEAAPKALNNTVLSVEDFKTFLSKENQIALKLIAPEVKEEKPSVIKELIPETQTTVNQPILEKQSLSQEELVKVSVPSGLLNQTTPDWRILPPSVAQSSSSALERPINTLPSPIQSNVNADLMKYVAMLAFVLLMLYVLRPRVITGPLNFFCGRKRRKSIDQGVPQEKKSLLLSNSEESDIEKDTSQTRVRPGVHGKNIFSLV